MKKFIFLSLLALATMQVSFAQNKAVAKFTSETFPAISGQPNSIDTVVTTGSAVTKNQKLKSTRSASVFSVQVTATKISGTTAGIVRLYGSNDGVAWFRVKEGAALAAGDSLNLSNTASPQTIVFTDKPGRYLWYRAALTGSGTASTKFESTAVAAP